MVGMVEILTYAQCSRIAVHNDVKVMMVRLVFVLLDDDGIRVVVSNRNFRTSHLSNRERDILKIFH